MLGSHLKRDSGLFPSGVTEVSLRCVDDDLFCWVFAHSNVADRLISLPKTHADAQFALACVLESEHGFAAQSAEQTAQALFRNAFLGKQMAAKTA